MFCTRWFHSGSDEFMLSIFLNETESLKPVVAALRKFNQAPADFLIRQKYVLPTVKGIVLRERGHAM